MDKKQEMFLDAINSSELLKAISSRDVEEVRRLLETDNTKKLVNKLDTHFNWSPLKWNNYFYEKNSSLAINETEKKNTQRLDDEIEAILLEHGANNEFNESIKPDYYNYTLVERTGGRRRKKSRKHTKLHKKTLKLRVYKRSKKTTTKKRKHMKK